MDETSKKLIEVKDLKTHFPIRAGVLSRTVGWVKAVDGVSFSIQRGQTLGLVGESGCGKTTVGRTLMRLIRATGGSFEFDGDEVFSLPAGRMKRFRQEVQMMFQDPFGSLNPRMTVEDIIGEPLLVHRVAQGRRRQRVAELMEKVGLSPQHLNRYPHEFSGGQRQRIGVARALALDPKFLICDEPVSALDVSIQSQIINLLQDLQSQLNLTYLFIAHDLAVVEHISDWVAVMYLGHIVEYANRDTLYTNPLHPYTVSLLSAIPEPTPNRQKKRIVLKGEVPSPSNPPSGCPFHPRCPLAEKRCAEENQRLEAKDASGQHWAACWKTTDEKIRQLRSQSFSD
ncbi:MAG: dipeptide ABC transporter ATP-binding protein [Planctomycetales bacterium]|nr:dipeptide ABC transporter ATP-binding protein [Planctomycetales bacterium]